MRHASNSDGRHEILLAATREFADHGYAGATTVGIARRAGRAYNSAGRVEALMPVYEYLCEACHQTFTKILTIAEHDKEKIVCPKCGCKHLPVVYTRPRAGHILRVRACRHCGKRVVTRERA